MKDRGFIDKVLHFIVYNTFMFTVVIMCFVHAALLAMTLYADVTPLAIFNVLSVVIYLFCIYMCKRGHIMPVYVSILVEVSAYSATAVHYIGWKSGSYNFLFSIVPIVVYFGSYLFKGAKRWIIIFTLAIIFGLYSFLYIRYSGVEPVYELVNTVRTIMMLFASFVMFFGVVFYSSLYIISSEIERTDLEKSNEQLSADALVDSMTGLLNRRGFIPLVEDSMVGENRRQFCVAFCDIDNFKRINDTYGHDCGDAVLIHISSMLKEQMSGCEICRWGGEEIVIFMKDYDFIPAKQEMEKMRKLVESTPTVFYSKRIYVTITIGLAEYRGNYRAADDIIRVADGRMYYGKQHGKNMLVCEG